MATVVVSVNVKPLQDTMARLSRKVESRAYLETLGLRILAWVDENFRAGGLEHPWVPLSPNTIASRRQGSGAGSAQPLRDTGRMAQSFVYELDPGGRSVWVGTRDEKAQWHQEGTRPYIIRPVRAKMLRFITASPQGPKSKRGGGGFFAFAKEVHHPGIPARPLLPTPGLARDLAVEVMEGFVQELRDESKR